MKSDQAVAALAALAHDYRLSIYRMLVEAGPPGLNAGTLAGRLNIPPSSLTFHVQQLHRAGLISQQRKSRELIYSTDFDVMNGLVGYLTENCCGGTAQMGAVCEPDCAPVGAARKSATKTAKPGKKPTAA
ncbi:MAG: transcriptional regulator, ArsR family [Gammaproteobacteria bacterium]|nr:transcriptional regulator, ArsR family [Gammaproteobacteria bacterium]